MDSEQKRTAAVAILFLGFLLVGVPSLGKLIDPSTSQTATFRGEERTVAVRMNRQAVMIVDDISGIEVFEYKGKVMTRHSIMAPRAGGVLITTRNASADESRLFHEFF
ncbi:MAG: hypothetical protein WAP55_01225 [Minisyncoccia bacterium]